MDFKEISNTMFTKKNMYDTINNKDKENSFYIINKKLSLISDKHLKIAQFFNTKYVKKDLLLDMWNILLRNINYVPKYFYLPLTKNKKKSIIPVKDKNLFLEYFPIKETELIFLLKYYKDDVDYEIKKLKRFNKNS